MKLLRRREQIATAAIEHTAHDLPGADFLWQAVQDVEETLLRLYPRTWQRHNAEWASRDADRLHTVGTPQPARCRLCAALAAPTASAS